MEPVKTRIREYLRGEITLEGQQELDAWLSLSAANRALFAELNDPDQVALSLDKLDQLHADQSWKRLQAMDEEEAGIGYTSRIPVWRRYGWAAAVFILLATGVWWFVRPVTRLHSPALVSAGVGDVTAPVINRATLTLAGGRRVFLDSAGNGSLAEQGGARVVKLANGEVAYQTGKDGLQAGKDGLKGTEVLYNTLTNPRGSQIISVTLSDGTKVWLNAESSLKYPAVFSGQERKVEITGEAYFEVKDDASAPFIVERGNVEVQVLGTHFNVNGYDNEQVLRVTLLEGSVKVRQEEKAVKLEPGQQVEVEAGGPAGAGRQMGVGMQAGTRMKVSRDVDLEAVMAWKNGLFSFSQADLPTVMRQLARWYNVDIIYEGNIPKDQFEFNGEIGKTLTLDQVLKLLTRTRVHYSIDGNKLTIRP